MKKRLLPLLLACFLLAACGEQDPADMWAPWVPEAPSLKWVQTDLSTIAVPEGVKVVGLGEASHEGGGVPGFGGEQRLPEFYH